MSHDIYWLYATLCMTAVMAFPYVLNRIAVQGLLTAMSNPSLDSGREPLHAWACRAQKAHANAVENLVIFAPAVLIIEFLGLNTSITATACASYFFARLLHYVIYTVGIPILRTLLFFVGWGATLVLLITIGGV